MFTKCELASRIVAGCLAIPEIDRLRPASGFFNTSDELNEFRARIVGALRSHDVEFDPQSIRASDSLAEIVERVQDALPGDGAPNLDATLKAADKLQGRGFRKQGLVFFLSVAVLAVILTAVWPRPAKPALPALKDPTAIAVGLKAGAMPVPARLPVCVAVVLSSTASPPSDPPRPVFTPAWLTSVRPQSDKTWVDLALSQADAAELARQLMKYEPQILRPADPGACAPLQTIPAALAPAPIPQQSPPPKEAPTGASKKSKGKGRAAAGKAVKP